MQREYIKQYLVENFLFSNDVSAIRDTDSLIHSGIVDSTGIHELILFIEERFNLMVSPEEMTPANFDNVSVIDEFVSRKLSLAEAG